MNIEITDGIQRLQKGNRGKILLALITFLMIGVTVLLGYVLYSVWDRLTIAREYYRGRFLLTATVEVDGKLKSGSSVIEVSYNARRRGNGFGASPINGARGTMPIIDLGEYGTLLLLFEKSASGFETASSCERTHPAWMPTNLMVDDDIEYNSFREVINAMDNATGEYSIGSLSLPALIIANGEKVQDARNLYFCTLENALIPNVLPVDITLEHTELPVNFMHSQAPIWLQNWRDEYGAKVSEASKTSSWWRVDWPYTKIFHFEREKFYEG